MDSKDKMFASDEDDLIKIENGRITIIHGLDESGEQLFNVKIDGDLTYIVALGLLSAAKDHVDMHYFGDDIEEEA